MREYRNEIVFRGHPDKLADQISDKILMEYLKRDPQSIVNIDVVGGEDTVFVTGKIKSSIDIDVQDIVREALADVGCRTDMIVINEIELNGLDECNNYENKIIYGYACNETSNCLPKGMVILQEIAKAYDDLCHIDKRFLSDGKVEMVGLYDKDDTLIKIKSIIVNHQNVGIDVESIKEKMYELILGVAKKYDVIIESCELNPYGSYLIGGFDRDTGLIGRKLNIDYYQGFASSNSDALSGRDPNSLFRSGTYKAREIAKSILKEHNLKWCEVELIYNDIEVNKIKPSSIQINSDKGLIKVSDNLYTECIPDNIVKSLDLINKDYVKLSSFGHFQN